LLAEHGVTSEPSHIDKASLARLEMWSGNKRRRWLWLLCLCILLIVMNACAGGNSSPSSVNPELGTYNVQVQGTTLAQPNPVTITTAGLSVQ